jgi:short-subunit dehydrogenase
MQLKGKRILLTGATGGVGIVLAQLLALKGARLALVGRDSAKLNALKQSLVAQNGEHAVITANFDVAGTVQPLVDEAIKKLESIDILINNAGILDFIQLEDQSEQRIAQMVQTNVTTLIQLTRALLPSFKAKNQGHFVMIGSIFGSLGFPHYATYCATKFAVHGFSQALRRELVNTNIKVTYIAPRGIKTPMNDANTTAMMEQSGNKMDTPEIVASTIIKAIENEKQEVFIGQPQSFFAWLNGVLPMAANFGLKKQTALAVPFLRKK